MEIKQNSYVPGNKEKNMYTRLHTLKEQIENTETIKESEKIISYYWQNIVLVVCLMAFLLFVGRYIIDRMDDKLEVSNAESWNIDENIYQSKADINSNSENMPEAAEDINNEQQGICITTEKHAYLTFDDGPSQNTDEILDILKGNNVKATFFVIGRDEEYYDTYRRIVNEGHTLALHTYTHDYNKIYSSVDNFINDIEELRNLLYDVTGVDCTYYRFPGGSTNSVSAVPMSELIEYIDSQGLVYYDWNSLNEDSVSGELPPETLVNNIMRNALDYDDTVVLMHDLNNRHTTVESLQMVIDRFKEEGYELLPIDESTPVVQYKK
jgi:peptidoglycan/xylan/chitin deacetylase (PgdA/CDA1 family)